MGLLTGYPLDSRCRLEWRIEFPGAVSNDPYNWKTYADTEPSPFGSSSKNAPTSEAVRVGSSSYVWEWPESAYSMLLHSGLAHGVQPPIYPAAHHTGAESPE